MNTPTAERMSDEAVAPYKFKNGYTAQDWREFIQNTIKGDNYFRGSEYYKLIGDLEQAGSTIESLQREIADLRRDAERLDTINTEDIQHLRMIAQTIEDGGWHIAALHLTAIRQKLEAALAANAPKVGQAENEGGRA